MPAVTTSVSAGSASSAAPRGAAAAFVLLVSLAAAAYFVALGLGRAAEGQAPLAGRLLEVRTPAQPAPDFVLESLTGDSVSLESLRGKTVFINFWATWCPPCIEEMPSLDALYEELKDEPDFAFLAISTDEGWDPVRKHFGSEPPAYPVLLDASGDLARRYGTTKFPETYVVRDGQIVGYVIGPRDWSTWYAATWLRGLLGSAS